MEPTGIKPNTGRILISVPFLQDFYFKKSVVLLAEHGIDGSFGIIINKPVEVKLSDIASEFEGFDAPVFLGGPVKTDSLYFIHTRPDLIEEGVPILDGLYWGGNIDMVKNLIKQKKLDKTEIRFFIGYAGWIADQLNRELEEKAWVVSMTNPAQVFKSNPLDMWAQTLKRLGNEYKFWVVYPPDPSYN
ncbi:MAG: YqgE/AlgH family protein [Chloroflexota bacterium]|jgi:putative transcriptional regulator|nr:YqgE/AlgH family protein [Lentimicrobium sp.]